MLRMARFLPPGRTHDHDDRDRKSTRLNSSHANISYAVFCLKKKTHTYYYSSIHPIWRHWLHTPSLITSLFPPPDLPARHGTPYVLQRDFPRYNRYTSYDIRA